MYIRSRLRMNLANVCFLIRCVCDKLLISCGEVSSSQITVLRLLNQSVDFVFDNVSRNPAPVFTNLRS
ncbi:hypothetical protein Bca52824_009815 [Brassica carinata]|uniref:Uncharacterized protein n=1 Tax=Brassica carinata TaxID=52824 RepID=A0A8X8BAM8_BRACI|nr:hypothetical protein Bca52824_009815 [Brassica carinata]